MIIIYFPPAMTRLAVDCKPNGLEARLGMQATEAVVIVGLDLSADIHEDGVMAALREAAGTRSRSPWRITACHDGLARMGLGRISEKPGAGHPHLGSAAARPSATA